MMLTLTIDIHGLTVSQAKPLLENKIRYLHKKYNQICVIHGYHTGNRLQLFVRKQLKAPRLKQKILTMNPGETILLIDPPSTST